METNTLSPSPNLGALIAEHRANPRAQGEALWAGWGLIATGAAFALIGYSVAKGEWPDLLVAAAGLPLVIIGVIALSARQRRRSLSVQVFAGGFTRTLGGQTVAVRWDEVAEVQAKVLRTYKGTAHTNTQHRYIVRLTDGRKFVFDDQIEKIMGLGAALQRQCSAQTQR